MDTLETVHTVIIGNRCFGQIYGNLKIQELLELEVHEVDSSVQKTTERRLLKLTALHRLFQLWLSGRPTCGKLNDVCHFLISSNIITKLVSCLEDTNHHVVFMASKAISSLMLSILLISATRIQLRRLFQGYDGFQWKSLYVMNILKQVIGSRVGDTALYNVKSQSQVSLTCNCVSIEPKVSRNEERKSIELLDFIMAQEWMTILPSYVPLWKEIFVRCIDDITKNSSCTSMDLLEYHSKLASSTHQRMQDGCFNISARSEQIFVSFLSFTAEFFEWTFRFCCSVDPTKYAICERIFEKLEYNKQLLLLKIVQAMPHFLHVTELSSEVWKEILKILSFSLNTNTCMQGSQYHQNQTPTSNSTLHSTTAFICAVNCGILNNLPENTGVEGFGGSTVKPSKNKPVESWQSDKPVESWQAPNTGLFRQASLLVVQSALVLMNSCENYRNAQLSQDIFKAINIWYDGMIKVGSRNHDNEETYEKGLSNHNNQEEYQRQPSVILLDIFADQDDEMIQIMLQLLKLFKVSSSEAVYQDATVILSTLNPHLIFQAFLKVVGFDHSVLLDFLISSETVFLEYLMQYLHFVLQDWQGFCQSNNNLVEDTITTDDDETGIRSSLKNCEHSHHINVGKNLKPVPDYKTASSPAGIVCNQASSSDISGSSVGLGGLLNICFAYGSDIEDNDHDVDEEDDMMENNSELEYSEDVGIYKINAQRNISNNDNTEHSYINCGSKVERKHGCNTDDDGSVCNENSDNEGDDFGVCNSACRNERKHGMSFVSITHMNHDDDDKQRACLVHDDDDEDDTDVYDNEEDAEVDDHNKISSAISIHFQGAADSLSTLLENIMSTLIHTRIAAERLNDGSLFPYQVKPLINVMKKVEELYDGC